MTTMLVLLEVAGLVGIVFFPFQLRRNNHVHAYRQGLIDQIHAASMADLDNGLTNWQWRYDAFYVVTYEQMLWRFWQPLDSFYDDLSFTRPRTGAAS